MELTVILLVGVAASVFVGFNIGGSSTGVVWGPAVGVGLVKKTTAAAVMTFFVFLGGWTVGRNVIDTLANDIITTAISLEVGVAVLFFIGLGILIANVFSVPVPTSMTTVGSIAGLGLATGTLQWETMGRIGAWWIFTPLIGFWIGSVIGRYLYPHLDRHFKVSSTPGALLVLDQSGTIPKPALGPNTTHQEFVGTIVVLVAACYMAFSAGASNVPNAVAPLVSDGALSDNPAILLGTVAIGLGGFTIARRTMDSVGGELSDIPLLAAVIVMVTAATITTILSYIGIPISLVMATVMTIVGLGWGRASRLIAAKDLVQGEIDVDVLSMGALKVETPEKVPEIGEEEPEVMEANELFNPQAVTKFVLMWVIGPCVSLGLSYAFFVFFPFVG
ncbi:phosphate transporter family protein [Halalkalicoccus paucihalophilus]|uniref:Phosphate transporter n=1 Tax=Halalkalicoccus paucihalophilus TaxID=1008153 RepID=A0A151A9N1_9EURY|nr:inorganic phosphate transporter [Halalkalicoccus paucihalophilus]KYH24202.1 phosphate transporter family protein [Halalkalicoccus paucihalophilus]